MSDTSPPPSTSDKAQPDDVVPSGAHHARLGDLLVNAGIAERNAVEYAAEDARAHHERIGQALVREGVVEPTDVYRALATQWRIPLAHIESLAPLLDIDLAEALPRSYLERHGLFLVARSGADVVVATTDPTVVVDDVLKALRARAARLVLVTPTDYRRLWMLADLRRGRAATAPEDAIEGAQGKLGEQDLLAQDPNAHPRHVALFEALLIEAIAERASDLHLEHDGRRVRVRMRVDGDLFDFDRIRISPEDLSGVVNVIKVQANLDISEHRLPQGGRIRRHAGGKAYDMRVQTQPSLHAEHVIIRLLPQETKVLTIEDLGFPGKLAHDYRRLLDSPGGLVLVVGPTGSGKSTTLYAGLQHIARDQTRKVITIEDPIEYSIAGVQQTQVKPEVGFAFQHAMRAFVRQDPDVILVGEIRDGETALEAIRASQTGHLVLSTLHCNDAVDAIQRLIDLGMHPNSVASELLAVIAQRLAKRICDACRVQAEPDPEILSELFPRGAPADFRCYTGRGCNRCRKRGTIGRIATIEFLRSSPEVRRAISRNMSVDELRDIALDAGLVTMRQTALELVQSGAIPLSELPWILPAERMAPEAPRRTPTEAAS